MNQPTDNNSNTDDSSGVWSPGGSSSSADFEGFDCDNHNEELFPKFNWCRICRSIYDGKTFHDHLVTHVTQPNVRLTRIDPKKLEAIINKKRKPIKLRLKKVNTDSSGISSFTEPEEEEDNSIESASPPEEEEEEPLDHLVNLLGGSVCSTIKINPRPSKLESEDRLAYLVKNSATKKSIGASLVTQKPNLTSETDTTDSDRRSKRKRNKETRTELHAEQNLDSKNHTDEESIDLVGPWETPSLNEDRSWTLGNGDKSQMDEIITKIEEPEEEEENSTEAASPPEEERPVAKRSDKLDIKKEFVKEAAGGSGGATRDEGDSTCDSGVASPPQQASPTPSELLRPQGYMAPSPPDLESQLLENGALSPTMSCISTASTVLFERTSPGRGDESGEDRTRSPPHLQSMVSNQDGPTKENNLDADQDDSQSSIPKNTNVDYPGMLDISVSRTASPNVGNITVRSAAELLSPQGLMNNSGTNNSVTADTFQALQGLVSDVQTNEGLKVLSPVDMGLLNGNSGGMGESTSAYTCDVCGESAQSRQSMELHKAQSGHYRCPIGPDCPMFSSAMDLASHYHANHSSNNVGQQQPVHQLQQQVHRLQQVLPGGVTLVSNRSHSYQQQKMQPNNGRPSIYSDQVYGQYPTVQQGQQQMVINPTSGSSGSTPSLANLPPGVQISQAPAPSPPPSLANLPPGVQVSKRPAPGPVSLHPAKTRRRSSEDSEPPQQQANLPPPPPPQIKLPDSITLVRPGVSITSQKQRTNGTDASSVANMLATRGITVVPSSGGRSNGASSATVVRRNSTPQTSAPVVANLNSAVSITPSPHRTGGNFAVPGRSGRGSQPPTPKLPTVDLTHEEMPQPLPPPPPPPGHHPRPMAQSLPSSPRVGRAAARARVTCQVCDKIFANPEALSVHMQSHRQGGPPPQPIINNSMRSANKIPFECNLCTAQYPTQQGLLSHKQKYHQETEGPDLVLPVVDLKQPGTLQRLSSLGIRNFIPLAQLHNQAGGMYALPIVSVDSARNPAVCNIGGIGASNLFPLGPLKSLR